MNISTGEIQETVYSTFQKRYKAFGDFVGSGEIWDMCVSALRDTELMNNIIFCNDIHQIPPVNTFLKVHRVKRDLTEYEKRAVGAFWGFVFKHAFGYRNQKSVAARVNTVKTATYFFDAPHEKIAVFDDR
jgi:hypothetical protein